MSHITRPVIVGGLVVLTLSLVPPAAGAQQWVAAWGSSLQGASPDEWSMSDATMRLVARSTLAGSRVRVRLENTYGSEPLTIAAASIALRNVGPWLVAGSSRSLRFDESASVTIPPGQYVFSDPVDLTVDAGQDLAISLYVPGTTAP